MIIYYWQGNNYYDQYYKLSFIFCDAVIITPNMQLRNNAYLLTKRAHWPQVVIKALLVYHVRIASS